MLLRKVRADMRGLEQHTRQRRRIGHAIATTHHRKHAFAEFTPIVRGFPEPFQCLAAAGFSGQHLAAVIIDAAEIPQRNAMPLGHREHVALPLFEQRPLVRQGDQTKVVGVVGVDEQQRRNIVRRRPGEKIIEGLQR